MATLVVLRFEDNDEANYFIESQKYMLTAGDYIENADPVTCEVIGRYRTPTLFCECKGGGKSWAWEPTHGWVVHASYLRRNENGCMRPSLLWGKSHRAVISSAINHINPDDRWVQKTIPPKDLLVNEGLLK